MNGIPRTGLSDGEKLYVKSKAQTALGAFLALGLGLAALANRTARALVAKRRESLEAVGQGDAAQGDASEAAEREAEALGATSGLVPIFWSEALAVQTAAGKRRKLLFFREGDLQAYLVLTADY